MDDAHALGVNFKGDPVLFAVTLGMGILRHRTGQAAAAGKSALADVPDGVRDGKAGQRPALLKGIGADDLQVFREDNALQIQTV